MMVFVLLCLDGFFFFFSSRRRHTRCALVTGVQTCALPICSGTLWIPATVAAVSNPSTSPTRSLIDAIRGTVMAGVSAGFEARSRKMPQDCRGFHLSDDDLESLSPVLKVASSRVLRWHFFAELGIAHVWTPVTNVQPACRFMLINKRQN